MRRADTIPGSSDQLLEITVPFIVVALLVARQWLTEYDVNYYLTERPLMSLTYSGVQKMKAIQPEWAAGLLATTLIGNLPALEVDFLAVNAAAISASLVSDARAAGKDVYAWTVNDPLSMSRMASLGVAGLITDKPSLVTAVLKQRADLSAVERLVLALGSSLGLTTEDSDTKNQSP